jgi:hypothetical protein
VGDRYSYAIAVPTRNVSRVLTTLAAMGPKGDRSIEVTLPGGERLVLPFTSKFRSEPVDCSDGRELELDTSILLDPADDELAQEYFARELPVESGRFSFGYLYLTVNFASDLRPGYAELEFHPATTAMGLLIQNAPLLQRTFTALTVAGDGVCGWLDRAFQYGAVPWEVRWLNGEERTDSVPGPRYSSLGEVAQEWPDFG